MTVSLTVNDDAEKLGVIELTCTGSNSLGVSSKSTNIQLTGMQYSYEEKHHSILLTKCIDFFKIIIHK